MTSVSVNNIVKVTRRNSKVFTIIDKLSMQVKEGEFICIVGPSGSGKTTLLRILAGLESDYEGNVVFDFSVVDELSPAQRKVGIVFQSFALYPYMTVLQNLSFPLKMLNFSQNEIQRVVEPIVADLGIGHLVDQYPNQLSVGQQQLVAIGRAIVKTPKVFLLDEPLSNLDSANKDYIRELLVSFHRKIGCTTFYVTHDITEAMILADRILLLAGGKILQFDSPLDLYEFPISKTVAEFIGQSKMNMLRANFVRRHGAYLVVNVGNNLINVAVDAGDRNLTLGDALCLGIRPEDLFIGSVDDLLIKVERVEFLGHLTSVKARTIDTNEAICFKISGSLDISVGQIMYVAIPSLHAHLFDENGVAFPRQVTLANIKRLPEQLL